MSAETEPADGIRFAPDAWGVDASGDTYLNASRCARCGAIFYPPLPRCARCLEEAVERLPIAGEGTLYSYTVVHVRRAGYPRPYALGFADFPAGLRVFGRIDLSAGVPLRTGMRVRLGHGPLRQDAEGHVVVGYRFEPAGQPSAPGAGAGAR